VLQRVRSRNLPDRIDTDYLRDAGVPEGSLGRTMFALEFIGLVRDTIPTPALRSIATSTDEEYRSTLAGLIRDSYREVFETLDPAQDAQDRILNFFRRYTPASQRPRMVTFFLALCREAGINTLDVPRARAAGVSRTARSGSTRPQTGRSVRSRPPAPTASRADGTTNQGSTIPSSLMFGVTDDDIAALDESDFNEVWAALGKVARARARARTQAKSPIAQQSANGDGTQNDDL